MLKQKIQLGANRRKKIQGGNMDGMDLASSVSRLMKEDMFPPAERGLDHCRSSDSSTLTAIIFKPIGPMRKVRCVQRADCLKTSFVGIYLCSGR